MKKIFLNFDSNGSNSLDFKELVEMFKHFNFDMDLESINRIF